MPDQESVSWKLIAEERLQMLIQMRDEAQAWNEAFLKERERGDRLFLLLSATPERDINETKLEELKVAIQSPMQINNRRANWPRLKHQLEKQFAGSKNPTDLQGQEIKLNDDVQSA